MARAEVRGAPFDDAGDQVVAADDARDAVLHQAVAERDEGADAAQRRQRRLVVGGLEGHEREVEALVRRLGHRLHRDGALLAEVVEPQSLVEPRDVVRVGVEHHHPPHVPGELRGGHAADRPAAHHQHRRVDHVSSSSRASAA